MTSVKDTKKAKTLNLSFKKDIRYGTLHRLPLIPNYNWVISFLGLLENPHKEHPEKQNGNRKGCAEGIRIPFLSSDFQIDDEYQNRERPNPKLFEMKSKRGGNRLLPFDSPVTKFLFRLQGQRKYH